MNSARSNWKKCECQGLYDSKTPDYYIIVIKQFRKIDKLSSLLLRLILIGFDSESFYGIVVCTRSYLNVPLNVFNIHRRSWIHVFPIKSIEGVKLFTLVQGRGERDKKNVVPAGKECSLQGTNGRNQLIAAGCVYSAYILKPVLSGRNL